jgi:hypothetical protein
VTLASDAAVPVAWTASARHIFVKQMLDFRPSLTVRTDRKAHGKDRALARLARHRHIAPGYEASSIFGLGAPKSTPAEIVDRLNKEINAALVDPKFKAQLANLDGMVLGGSPADFGKLLADETEKWAKVIRTANIKPE